MRGTREALSVARLWNSLEVVAVGPRVSSGYFVSSTAWGRGADHPDTWRKAS